MTARKTTYVFHRWIGLVVSIQLLAWSLGGLIFSISPIDSVRGRTDATEFAIEAIPVATIDSLGVARPTSLQDNIAVGSVTLVDRGLGPFWEWRDQAGDVLARVDPASGNTMAQLTENNAIALAQRDFKNDIAPTAARATLITKDPPTEYRAGVLPAWQVELEHSRDPHIYINAQTGAITARRNWLWRTFDFFWMLHTMDYAGRDNFNHLLLTSFSVLAVLTSASGLTLWSWRAVARWKWRKSQSA